MEIFIVAGKYRIRHIKAQYMARTQLHSGALKDFFPMGLNSFGGFGLLVEDWTKNYLLPAGVSSLNRQVGLYVAASGGQGEGGAEA